MKYQTLHNNQNIKLNEIPVLSYPEFLETNLRLLGKSGCHCVNYFGYKTGDFLLKLLCCIADDSNAKIYINAHELNPKDDPELQSMTATRFGMHPFEREIAENFGVRFKDNPWDKPLRYSFNRFDKEKVMANYPFYSIESHELHEVGVGPIHAGVIEPGHFRFICDGEKVLHLEIQLGYQHRGVEHLMVAEDNLLKKTLLAESIAGDTVVGHALAFAANMESLAGISVNPEVQLARSIALELERIAIHTGDLSALCTDVAYQLGSSVLQGLRTWIINSFLNWCGNRFARKLIRVGDNPYPLMEEFRKTLLQTLSDFEERFEEMTYKMFDLPSVLSRFERTGIVTFRQTEMIESVGMAARTCGLPRDIRQTHPFGYFTQMPHEMIILASGDVYARAKLRKLEVEQSLRYIRTMLDNSLLVTNQNLKSEIRNLKLPLASDSFSISLTEGWRGEICHCTITGKDGRLLNYKIADASLHNWMALALAVRNNDISDFPVCNKSFDLSYCGHDL